MTFRWSCNQVGLVVINTALLMAVTHIEEAQHRQSEEASINEASQAIIRSQEACQHGRALAWSLTRQVKIIAL